MTATDAIFWYAESALPTLRPVIAGLFQLDRAPDPEAARAGLDAALALVPRLRQRVVEVPLNLGLPEWSDDPHFDRDYHVRRLSLPEPGDRRQLLDLLATLLATPLDHERPLWEGYWIEGLTDRKAAFFLKLHHALVDGVGSVAILDALTQRNRDARPPPLAPSRADVLPRRGPLTRMLDVAADNLRQSARLSWHAAAAPLRFAVAPGESVERVRRTARGLQGIVRELARPRIVDPIAQPGSGLSRRLDVLELPLERLQTLRGQLGATLNDLVLCALAGALGSYHREHRVRIPQLNCLVPMSLRGRGDHAALGNRVGTFNIELPVGERRPERRLRRVVEQTGAAKQDRRGAAVPFLAQSLTLLPGISYRWIARELLGYVNVLCTNVPGPREQRYMAGAQVEGVFPFVSVVEGMPFVMALFSYAGKLEIGIDTDPEAIPDPQRIREGFEVALAELEALAKKPRRASRGRRPSAPTSPA